MNGFDNQGRTALHLAAERGHDKVLAILLAREDLDDVDPRDLLGQRTPLYLVRNLDRCIIKFPVQILFCVFI